MSLPPEQPTENENTLTFRVKRSHFYAVMVPLAFLLGLTVGYLAWSGPEVDPSAQLASSQAELEGSQPAAQALPTERPLSVAEQIEALERYDISIEDHDPVSGTANAPITVIEFSDFECPFCQRHFAEVYPRLVADYPDEIRYVYKDFPLTSIHPNAIPAALAAQCAFEQGQFWEFHDLLFGGTQGLSRSSYEAYASQLDLDADAFAACLDEDRYLEAVTADRDYALELGVGSTPTFFINGIPVVGAQPYEVFAQIIDYELGQSETAE